jgi:hypothetical protein
MPERPKRDKSCFGEQTEAENCEVICGAFLYKGVVLFLHRKYIASYSGQRRSQQG